MRLCYSYDISYYHHLFIFTYVLQAAFAGCWIAITTRASSSSSCCCSSTCTLIHDQKQKQLLLLQRQRNNHHHAGTTTLLHMNIFDALIGGGNNNLQPIKSLPYGDPILPVDTSTTTTLAIQERGLSFTGEDFDIIDSNKKSVCRVRGALLHLPGKDKMRFIDPTTDSAVATIDRKLIAVTPTYDIYRQNEKIAWIEKVMIGFRDTFEVHLENAPKFGPIKPPAAYKLEGDFLDRKFIMKDNIDGNTVAIVSKDGLFQFDAFNSYQVQIAPGMDPGLVITCACAIDEEFDEEHQRRKKEQEQGNNKGWFG